MNYLYLFSLIYLINQISGSNDLFKYYLETKNIPIDVKLKELHFNLTQARNTGCGFEYIEESLNKVILNQTNLVWPQDNDKIVELLDKNVLISFFLSTSLFFSVIF
jgi:hypothetical protein